MYRRHHFQINHWSIDSLRIRIKLSNLISYDKDLAKNILQVAPSGEIVGERKNMFEYSKNGIRVFAQINEYLTSFQTNQRTQFLEIAFSSKLLKHRYFTGITNYHLKYLSKELQTFGFAKWNFKEFTNSTPIDIDIKKDVIVDSESEIIKWFDTLELLTKVSKNYGKGYNLFNNLKKRNLGIEYGKRVGSTSLTLPYLKYYYKNWELQTKSKLFNDTYLSNTKNPIILSKSKILRNEFTIKGKKQFKQFISTKPFTLSNILNLSQSELNRESNRIHLYYIDLLKLDSKTQRSMTQKEIIIRISLTNKIDDTHDYNEILNSNFINLVSQIDRFTSKDNKGRKLKSVLSKEIKEIYNDLLKNKTVIISTQSKLFNAFIKK